MRDARPDEPEIERERALDLLSSSAANYWLGTALDGIVSIAFVAVGFIRTRQSWAAAASALAAGAMAYTLIEYASHRWIYHGPWPVLRRIHAQHHEDTLRLIGAPVFLWSGLCLLFWAAACLVLEPALAAIVLGALLFGTVYHGLIHHFFHNRPQPGEGAIGALRLHHLVHHGRDDFNFGVSTTLWDRVFRTRAKRD